MPENKPTISEELKQNNFVEPQPPRDTPTPVEKQKLEKQDEKLESAQNPELPEAPKHEQQRHDRFDAPLKLDPEDGETIHLPTLISDEFGVSVYQAEREILASKVTVDGEPYDNDSLRIPVADIRDKELKIKGQSRTFVLTYA